MLPLARALGASGHDVLWAAADEVCSHLREKGFAAVRCGLGADEAGPMPTPSPEVAALPPTQWGDFLFADVFGPRRAAPMLGDLVPIVEEWRPQLMICDQAEFAGPIAAARAGAANVTHRFGSLLPEGRVARVRDSVEELWRSQGLEPRPYGGTYDHLYLDIFPPSLQNSESGHVGEIQLLRPAMVPLDGSAREIVWVTFGTVFNDDLGPFRTAVEAVATLDVRVVVTLGPGHDPNALGEQPPNVTVARFIPQDELLPRCAAVVAHAGSGTLLGSLAAGVPQVLVPLAADQFLNAKAAERGGVARVLWPGELSVANVREALKEVLADTAMLDAAGRVGAEIAAMPPPEAVADELTRRFG